MITRTTTAQKQLLERLAERGEVLDYLACRFKGLNNELAWMLEHGFDEIDYRRLAEWLGDESGFSQAEANKEENAWMDKQR